MRIGAWRERVQGTRIEEVPCEGQRLRRDFLQRRAIVLVTAEEHPALEVAGATVTAAEPYRLSLSVDPAATSIERVVTAAFARLTVRDLVVEHPPLEDIVKAIYRGGRGGRETGHALA